MYMLIYSMLNVNFIKNFFYCYIYGLSTLTIGYTENAFIVITTSTIIPSSEEKLKLPTVALEETDPSNL